MDGNALLSALSLEMHRLRKARGLTIEQAANIAGVCTTSVWSVENRHGCNILTLLLIAETYGVTLSELFKNCGF